MSIWGDFYWIWNMDLFKFCFRMYFAFWCQWVGPWFWPLCSCGRKKVLVCAKAFCPYFMLLYYFTICLVRIIWLLNLNVSGVCLHIPRIKSWVWLIWHLEEMFSTALFLLMKIMIMAVLGKDNMILDLTIHPKHLIKSHGNPLP